MNEKLFQKWLDEEVEDIQTCLVLWGVAGILERFENWLIYNKYINTKKVKSDLNNNTGVKCELCNDTGKVRYWHDAGDHFSGGTPMSEWRTKPCKCQMGSTEDEIECMNHTLDLAQKYEDQKKDDIADECNNGTCDGECDKCEYQRCTKDSIKNKPPVMKEFDDLISEIQKGNKKEIEGLKEMFDEYIALRKEKRERENTTYDEEVDKLVESFDDKEVNDESTNYKEVDLTHIVPPILYLDKESGAIETLYVLQKTVRFAYKYKNNMGLPGSSKTQMRVFKDSLYRLTNEFKANRFVRDIKFEYDETIWPPDHPNWHGNVFSLHIQPYGNDDPFTFYIDMNNDENCCVFSNGISYNPYAIQIV